MISPNQELRIAVFNRLTSGSRRVKWPVYIDPHQSAPLPYIIIGETFRRDDSRKHIPGYALTLRIHYWSKEETWQECETMESDFMNSITFTNDETWVPLVMTNFVAGYCEPSDSSQVTTPDDKHLIGDYDFRVYA